MSWQTELTSLHYRLDCEKKLEAQKARVTGLLNVLIGLFACLTALFFVANRGSGTNAYLWVVFGLGVFTIVLFGAKWAFLRKAAKLMKIIDEEFSSENLVKSDTMSP